MSLRLPVASTTDEHRLRLDVGRSGFVIAIALVAAAVLGPGEIGKGSLVVQAQMARGWVAIAQVLLRAEA